MTTKIKRDENEQKILNGYLTDLNTIFSEKLKEFINDKKQYNENTRMAEIKLIAMLQEMIKVKKLILL